MQRLSSVEITKSVDFLDLHIFKDFSFQRTGKLSFSTYQKAFNKYLYIPFKSFHLAHNKKAFIRGELIRYVKNSSTISSYLSMRKRFYYRLRLRGYPPRFLIPVFASVSYQDRHKWLKPLATTKKTGKPPVFFKTQLNAGHLRIKSIIKKYLPNTNVVTCYKRTRTLKHLVKTFWAREEALPLAQTPHHNHGGFIKLPTPYFLRNYVSSNCDKMYYLPVDNMFPCDIIILF